MMAIDNNGIQRGVHTILYTVTTLLSVYWLLGGLYLFGGVIDNMKTIIGGQFMDEMIDVTTVNNATIIPPPSLSISCRIFSRCAVLLMDNELGGPSKSNPSEFIIRAHFGIYEADDDIMASFCCASLFIGFAMMSTAAAYYWSKVIVDIVKIDLERRSTDDEGIEPLEVPKTWKIFPTIYAFNTTLITVIVLFVAFLDVAANESQIESKTLYLFFCAIFIVMIGLAGLAISNGFASSLQEDFHTLNENNNNSELRRVAVRNYNNFERYRYLRRRNNTDQVQDTNLNFASPDVVQ